MGKKSNNEDKLKELNNYLKQNKHKTKPDYYVKDTLEGDEEKAEMLFILESPHKEEVKTNIPLVGNSGSDISAFLYGNEETQPFGKKISTFSSKKIGIMNVSNIPLQVLKETDQNTNYNTSNNIYQELKELRNLENTNDTLFNFFCEKIIKYRNVKTFVICGKFSEVYFDKYILEEKEHSIIKKQYQGEIEILKVPHPSYGHWQFIDKHKDNLERLKEIFSEFNEK